MKEVAHRGIVKDQKRQEQRHKRCETAKKGVEPIDKKRYSIHPSSF